MEPYVPVEQIPITLLGQARSSLAKLLSSLSDLQNMQIIWQNPQVFILLDSGQHS